MLSGDRLGLGGGSVSRDVYLDDLTRLSEVDGRGDLRGPAPQVGPVVRTEHNQSHPAAGQVLLILDVLIASNEGIETSIARGLQEFPVDETLPAQEISVADFMF